MKVEYEKTIGNPIKEIFRIFVEIHAVKATEKKIFYVVDNMAHSLGYELVRSEK